MRSARRFLEGALIGMALGIAMGLIFFRKGTQRIWEGLRGSSPSSSLESISVWDVTAEPCPERQIVETEPWVTPPLDEEMTATALATEGTATEDLATALGTTLATEDAAAESLVMEDLVTEDPAEAWDFESVPVWAETPGPELEVTPDPEAMAEEAVEAAAAEAEATEKAAAQEQAEAAAAAQAAAAEAAAAAQTAAQSQAEPEAAAAEAAVEAEVVEQVETAPSQTSADDLKARIEETRRRIQRELEQPFVGEADVAGAETAFGQSEVVIGEAVAVGPLDDGEMDLEVEEAPVLVAEEPGTGGADVAEGSSDATADVVEIDYEVMRGRIDETRNRLKAKAFDAMMTGESALLGRDPSDAPRPPSAAEVDGEIGQTIDATLTEEEV